MKTGKVLLVSAGFVLLVSAALFAQDKYVSKPNEELYGTWTNSQHDPTWQVQKEVVSADGYKDYAKTIDTVPLQESTLHIDGKWTDSEGNIWYKLYGTLTSGPYAGYNWQTLEKLSKSGTVRETQRSTAAQYDPAWYPTELKPDDQFYSISYRAGGSAAPAYSQTKDFFELVKTGTPQDVQAAISKGADVNAKDTEGYTPLMWAGASNPNAEVITTLLKAGADVNARDSFYDRTALMYAALFSQIPGDVITTLLSAGEDAKVKDNTGKTAFDYAQVNWRLSGTDALKKLEEASK